MSDTVEQTNEIQMSLLNIVSYVSLSAFLVTAAFCCFSFFILFLYIVL